MVLARVPGSHSRRAVELYLDFVILQGFLAEFGSFYEHGERNIGLARHHRQLEGCDGRYDDNSDEKSW